MTAKKVAAMSPTLGRLLKTSGRTTKGDWKGKYTVYIGMG